MDAPPQEGAEVDEGVFSGYAAVFSNIDSGGDVIEPGAFTKTLAENNAVKIFALHKDDGLPIGIPQEMREDANGLWVKGKISDTTLGRDVRTLLRDGVLFELSIGYEPVIFEYDEKGIRHLREVRLHEFSVVTWAMNPAAQIVDYKALADAQRARSRKGKNGGKRIVIECRDPDNSIQDLLEYLKKTAGGGHSFDVIVDPDNPDHEKQFGIDGDGADEIYSIQVEPSEKSRRRTTTQPKRRKSPALSHFQKSQKPRIKITF